MSKAFSAVDSSRLGAHCYMYSAYRGDGHAGGGGGGGAAAANDRAGHRQRAVPGGDHPTVQRGGAGAQAAGDAPGGAAAGPLQRGAPRESRNTTDRA
eukprot:4031881-Pyramimonas_sp.AAC.1